MPVVLASFVAVLAVAPPAQADPGTNADASFLAALDQAGVPYHSGAVAVAVGKKACQMMDQGHPQYDVIQDVTASNPGFAASDASRFTTIAVGAYCPQHAGEPTTQPPPPPSWTIPPEFPWPAPPGAA